MRTAAQVALGTLVAAFARNAVRAADVDRNSPIVAAVAGTKDAVVNLRTMRVVPARLEEAEGGGRVRGLGTGVLIDSRGYVVTNYHVVEKVDRIHALTSMGKEYPARVVNYDERADLAVLQIEADEKFPFLPLHGAGEPIVGETVIAIGNPWGLENTVTTGIVSAVNRKLPLPNDEVFDDLIQTDASINPGNSGGPLLSINGQLLGINVAIRSNAHRIGFAIPTRKVRTIVEDLLGAPPINIARQGLELKEVEGEIASRHRSLVRIDKVLPGSPAQRCGFQPGDELLAVGDEAVRVRFDLHRALWDRRFGDALTFKIRRNGNETRLLTMTVLPTDEPSDEELLWQKLGIRVRSVAAERVRPINEAWNGGLLLLQVAAGSPADKAGFRPGDILIGLHGYETVVPNNVRFVMQWKDLAEHQPVSYYLVRDGALLPAGRIHLPSNP